MVDWFKGADGVGEGDALAMTRLVSYGISQQKARQAIDLLLEDKSDEFRATVFELCRQIGWPDDEPSFLFAIMTNQLQALVKQYPERISEAMATAARQLEQDWQRIQADLSLAAVQQNQVLGGMTTTLTDAQLAMHDQLSQARQLMADERSAMMQALADERDSMRRLLAKEREAATRQLMALADKQKQVLEAHTKDLIAQAVVANQKRTDQQVKQIVKGVRMKHFWETIAVALLASMSILAVGWVAGLLVGRQPQLSSQLELLRQHAGIQQQETGWLLEKANRVECFYGIKTKSDPQCS